MKTKIIIATIFLCSWISQATAQNQLQAYIDTAVKNNPALHAYQFQSNAIQQKIKPAKSLDNLMLYGGVMNLPVNFSFTKDFMTMKQIGIQQNFSVAKKYSLKGAVAQKEFEASSYEVQAQQLSLIKQVKQQYYDLYAQTKSIEAAQNSIEAMKNYIGIANARYSSAQGTQQDVLKAQLELTKMQAELLKMQSDKEDMIAIFNTLLARNKMDSVNIPDKINFTPLMLNTDSLFVNVYANNPMLLAAKTTVEKDSAAYKLAKTSKIPDFNTNFWYGHRQYKEPDGSKAKDMLGLTFGITLPIYSNTKLNPLVAEANFNIKKSKSQFESMQNESELMVHHAMIGADKNQKLISIFEMQLIPQAEQTLSSAIIGYQENKIDFLTLTDNFLSLYNYRLQYFQAVADYMKAIADLEMLTNKNLISQ